MGKNNIALILIFSATIGSILFISLSWADLPSPKINLQGNIYLNGQVLKNAPLNMNFYISDGARINLITSSDDKGAFNCLLNNSFLDRNGNEVSFESDELLGIDIANPNATLSQMLTAAPYAQYAKYADTVDNAVLRVGDTMSGLLVCNRGISIEGKGDAAAACKNMIGKGIYGLGQIGIYASSADDQGEALLGTSNSTNVYSGYFTGGKGVKIIGCLTMEGTGMVIGGPPSVGVITKGVSCGAHFESGAYSVGVSAEGALGGYFSSNTNYFNVLTMDNNGEDSGLFGKGEIGVRGVVPAQENTVGVMGIATQTNGCGVYGVTETPNGVGVYGSAEGNAYSGYFVIDSSLPSYGVDIYPTLNLTPYPNGSPPDNSEAVEGTICVYAYNNYTYLFYFDGSHWNLVTSSSY